ncbi:bifunctional 3,4-dihydroxy-2-butanone-4-phosphate synthase/GTP cyclohydrolase II [Kiritimatiellota bacterium B12222]|nr:bifunctional 3,4-dihydroxy-2-butanone-4-phosphate synthase/GTP cyclohydrolase II [Kiritimatiellota bacterium B12222]
METIVDKKESVLDPIEEVIAAVGRGELVVVVDDEDRENEGDLICAADSVTPEMINFMATHGRGLICVTLPSHEVGRLGIAEMRHTGDQDVPAPCAFMESVDARHGISTGISASDRAATCRVLADPESGAGDLVRPGHMFPIKAVPKGVLGRAGHTEASVDLAKLSGHRPVGVICEIMNEDGSMARLDDLVGFAKKHGLKMSSVAALIDYRQQKEGSVKFEGEITLPTRHGDFQCRIYRSSMDDKEHMALYVGDITEGDAPLVRVHSECLTGDVLHSLRCDCGEQLEACMEAVQEVGRGIILYMRQEGRGIGLSAKLKAYALQDQGLDTVEANLALGFGADQREYLSSALILKDLGVESIRLLTNNPAKVTGLTENGIEVSERIPVVIQSNPHNAHYLETKRTRMGHLL